MMVEEKKEKKFSADYIKNSPHNFTRRTNQYRIISVKQKHAFVEFWAIPIALWNKRDELKQIYSKASRNTDLYVGDDEERSLTVKEGDLIKGVVVEQTIGSNKGMPLLVWSFSDEQFNTPEYGDHSIYFWKFKTNKNSSPNKDWKNQPTHTRRPKTYGNLLFPATTELADEILKECSSLTFESLFEDNTPQENENSKWRAKEEPWSFKCLHQPIQFVTPITSLGKHLRCRFQPRRKTNVLRLGPQGLRADATPFVPAEQRFNFPSFEDDGDSLFTTNSDNKVEFKSEFSPFWSCGWEDYSIIPSVVNEVLGGCE